ncbi:Biotin synthase [Fusarium oxysporum f. sp. albedinis]|nr:Biotin synthase [Fusarium oxysporum f. sp. albedinis]
MTPSMTGIRALKKPQPGPGISSCRPEERKLANHVEARMRKVKLHWKEHENETINCLTETLSFASRGLLVP